MRLETALVPIAFGLFVVLGLIGILHHEMWRDELEIWLIARDSQSLGHLFHNMRTEGHPALWYLLVFALTRLSAHPVSMQLLHLAISAGSVALILRYAPFSIWNRILLCFSYFVFYEFTIISRAYGLEYLLVFGFCALYPRRETRLPWLALLLFGMANTNLYGAIVAANLGLFLVLEAWWARGRVQYRRPLQLVSSAALFAVGVALGLGQIVVQGLNVGPAHNDYQPGYDLAWLLNSLSIIPEGYLPVPDLRVVAFWNTHVLDALPLLVALLLGAVLALALIAVSSWLLAPRRSVLALFLLGSGAMLSVTLFFWVGQLRHHGQIFLLFVVACWLAHAARDGGEDRRIALRERFLTMLLAVQVFAGVYAFVLDLRHPFSNAAAVAELLEQEPYAGGVLVGSHDFAMQPVSAYARRPIFHPENGAFRTFVDWGATRRITQPIDALEAAVALAQRQGEPTLMILSVGPSEFPPILHDLQLRSDAYMRYAAGFDGAIVEDENYVVVWVSPPPTR